jgi:hypothetical protein
VGSRLLDGVQEVKWFSGGFLASWTQQKLKEVASNNGFNNGFI